MAVISVEELGEGDGQIDRLYHRTYTRNFRVLCDNRLDGPVTIRLDPRIPKIGNSYRIASVEYDDGSFVETVTCTREKLIQAAGVTGCYWKVQCHYGPYDANTFPADPLLWPLRVSFGFQQFDKVVWEDINNEPITNSAGQRFAEPVTIDDSRPYLKIVRNESVYKASLVYQYKDAINTNAFLGAPAYTVKVNGIPGEIHYSPELKAYYAEVTYEFQYSPTKWKKIILDQGFCHLDASGKLTTNLDAKNQPLEEAALLDGSGHQLPHGGTPVFLEFDVYDEVDFSVFGFDFTNVPGLG